MLAGSLLVACTVNAQEYTPVYPQYSLWSNWSFGGSLSYNWEFSHGGALDWRKGTNVGVRLFFEKELNHVWSLRIAADAPGLWKPLGQDLKTYGRDGAKSFDRYGKGIIDFKFDYINACRGYNPDRKWSTYAFIGSGITVDRDDPELGNLGLVLEAGLGVGYKVAEHHYLFAEAYGDVAADIPNPIHQWHDMTGQIAVGYQYMWGPTQADLDMLAQRAMLTQENFDAKEKEIEGLRNDLRNAKNREDKLISRIAELEAGQANGHGGRGTIINNADNAVADSLRRIIEGYETNKHNFYALPFSILYGIDEYTVSEDQMNKINAIAQIMKDNKDVNFEIIGYCDYSGSDAYNQKLSERRAENVKKLLVRKGVSEDRLTTSGKGKSMSFGDIKNAINRRVSFYRSNN